MAVDTSSFRNGLKIELNGEPYAITYFQHVKPGKGGAFVRTKVKSLKSGKVVDKLRAHRAEQEAVCSDFVADDGPKLQTEEALRAKDEEHSKVTEEHSKQMEEMERQHREEAAKYEKKIAQKARSK